MFGFDSEGRITFNGTPYLYSSCGSTSEGLRRAEQKAAWLNRCLASALAAAQQAGVTDVARSQTIEVNPD